jgi:hypothetical protein
LSSSRGPTTTPHRARATGHGPRATGQAKTVLNQTFDPVSRPSSYTFEDLHTITAPTLILVGDSDQFAIIEDGVTPYRALPEGELAVLPNTPGGITPAAAGTAMEFCQRRHS